NTVSGTSLRAITVTEMSMGMVEDNDVSDSLGVGIFCGDYSQCEVDGNHVRDTRPDRASGDRTRMGYAIVAHYHAVADVAGNEVTRSPGGIGEFVDGRILP